MGKGVSCCWFVPKKPSSFLGKNRVEKIGRFEKCWQGDRNRKETQRFSVPFGASASYDTTGQPVVLCSNTFPTQWCS